MHLFRRGTSSLFGSSNVSLASSKTDTDTETDAVGDNALAQEGFRSISASEKLFTKTDPTIDGEDCLHDCATCTVKYPAKFDIDHEDELYGQVQGWATHMLVATAKSDWVRDVADEKGSLMEAIEKGGIEPRNGVSRSPTKYPKYPVYAAHAIIPDAQVVSIKHARPGRVPCVRARKTTHKRPPPAQFHRRGKCHATTGSRSPRALRQQVPNDNHTVRRPPLTISRGAKTTTPSQHKHHNATQVTRMSARSRHPPLFAAHP